MRRLRLILFLLLSLAIPLQGLAQFSQQQAPSHMTHDAHVQAADNGSIQDGCNDAGMAAESGQPCNTTQPCHSTAQFLPFAEIDLLLQKRAPSARYPQLADVLFSFDPAATWRPPVQL